MKTYMFPGQGSQSKGMGEGLFERFQELTGQADAILGYSVRALCLQDARDELGNTRFTQPALYVVNALSYFKKREEDGAPDFLAGHSLGEFNALMAAGCFDFETGLRLVQKRGELMAQVSGGAMAAVLNASKEQIEETLREHGLNNIYLANYNTPSQIVISGLADEIARAEPLFQQGKVRYYPLATSGAFHSVFMREAMAQFKDYLASFRFAAPQIPVIANITARPYCDDALLDTLAGQIASTVRWSETVQYLLAQGVARGEAMVFEELGPGDVLTKLAKTVEVQTPRPVLDALAAQLQDDAPAAPARPGVVAEDKVRAWNRTHPVGTRVRSTLVDAADLETRSEAVVLFGHRAAVYLKGYNGYFDLDELTPA
ncbi:ACP S-malonyltransferase [Chitiniphilus purpureus]|uniref:[acyl-carrier-protein] S-malonyltransferase n=1 Tax=Chitiniphilus purpureus TaxID=2981137 RepID=A0ABY6DP92_9NEIS|nr:ACP S-malonyltransferase [Chitiniphilus sp. CD1]UXY16194.1 ACP S-malonyltransferase [Chitiniphilus sp. CD1]